MKITTEVCKRELDSRFPATYGTNIGGWKRTSKTGNAAKGFVRKFEHRKLPVTATVIEKNGAIVSVEYASATAGVTTSVGATGSGATACTACAGTPTTAGTPGKPASNGTTSANEYLFAITRRRDGMTHFVMCPVAFWEQYDYMSDECMASALEGLLPADACEAQESCFETALSKPALREFMLAQGFQENESFSDYAAESGF